MKFVATFEMDFTQEELLVFKELSAQLGKSVGDTVRMCANEKANELLNNYKFNTPENNEEINGNTLEQIREGT